MAMHIYAFSIKIDFNNRFLEILKSRNLTLDFIMFWFKNGKNRQGGNYYTYLNLLWFLEFFGKSFLSITFIIVHSSNNNDDNANMIINDTDIK